MTSNTITLTRPDDAHLHLRDGAMLDAVIADSARQFGRAVVMPNLRPPVVNLAGALAYRARIVDAVERRCPDVAFTPLMTLYLTDQTSPDDIREAAVSGMVVAAKLYPLNATTNAEYGVTDIRALDPVFAAMTETGLALSIHGEHVSPETDVFDREAVFLNRVLSPLLDRHPGLRVVLEHVTTRLGVDFIRRAGDRVAGTLTAHHLLMNRNALFDGGLRPHHYCLPVLKRESDRLALLEAATSGDPCFFLGTDSAPHPRQAKESACGCAGVYTAFAALPLYAEAFESVGRLDRLDDFAGVFAARFYGWPKNTGSITLVRAPWRVDDDLLDDRSQGLTPFYAGKTLAWRLSSSE